MLSITEGAVCINKNNPTAIAAAQNGKFSFNYPADWLPLSPDSDSEWAAVIEGSTNMILFREVFDAGVIGIQTFDLSEDNPDIVIDEALLLDIADRFIEDIDTLNLIDKNRINALFYATVFSFYNWDFESFLICLSINTRNYDKNRQ